MYRVILPEIDAASQPIIRLFAWLEIIRSKQHSVRKSFATPVESDNNAGLFRIIQLFPGKRYLYRSAMLPSSSNNPAFVQNFF